MHVDHQEIRVRACAKAGIVRITGPDPETAGVPPRDNLSLNAISSAARHQPIS
jgi:hypothetical protein